MNIQQVQRYYEAVQSETEIIDDLTDTFVEEYAKKISYAGFTPPIEDVKEAARRKACRLRQDRENAEIFTSLIQYNALTLGCK